MAPLGVVVFSSIMGTAGLSIIVEVSTLCVCVCVYVYVCV